MEEEVRQFPGDEDPFEHLDDVILINDVFQPVRSADKRTISQ